MNWFKQDKYKYKYIYIFLILSIYFFKSSIADRAHVLFVSNMNIFPKFQILTINTNISIAVKTHFILRLSVLKSHFSFYKTLKNKIIYFYFKREDWPSFFFHHAQEYLPCSLYLIQSARNVYRLLYALTDDIIDCNNGPKS